MQQELINRIKEKAGVSDETAHAAAEAAIGFFKDKMPDSFADQIDRIAEGDSVTDAFAGSITEKFSAIGGMLDDD